MSTIDTAKCFPKTPQKKSYVPKQLHAILDHGLSYLPWLFSCYLLFTRFKNSSLVFALDRMQPNMQLVMVDAEVFSTPLITIHR